MGGWVTILLPGSLTLKKEYLYVQNIIAYFQMKYNTLLLKSGQRNRREVLNYWPMTIFLVVCLFTSVFTSSFGRNLVHI